MDDEMRRATTQAPRDAHINNPLTYRHQRIALNQPSHLMRIPRGGPIKREYKVMSEKFRGLAVLEWNLSKVQYYINSVWRPSPGKRSSAEFFLARRVAEQAMDLHKASIMYASRFEIFEGIGLTDKEVEQLVPLFTKKNILEEGVILTSSPTANKVYPWDVVDRTSQVYELMTDENYSILISPHLTAIVVPQIGVFLASRDHYLVMADIVQQRWQLTLHSMLENKSAQSTMPSVDVLCDLFEWGDDLLRRAGDLAYKVIYKFEPACVSLLVGDLPVGDPRGPTFREWVIGEMREYNESDILRGCSDRLFEILDRVRELNRSYLVQCFGLFRIWGHPTVEPLAGVSKLKAISTVVRDYESANVENLTCKFKELFITRYINRHGIWPDLDVSELSELNPIRIAYNEGGIYPSSFASYRRRDLIGVKFKQIFPVDPKFELSELLNDKSGSLPMNELLDAILEGHCGKSTDRSVLVKWLASNMHDPEVFLKNISENGFPHNECGTGCKSKEKEGKFEPRMFSLLCIVKRMYIVLTEALLAQHILPYFPEITMLDDGITIDQKRFAFARPVESRTKLYTSIDFTKWNSNMREHETYPLFEAFDEMFGLPNCYTRTHEMFKDSVIYLLDGSYLPPISEDGTGLDLDIGTIHNHLGGMEGLRQKGWTIWTVVLLLLCSEGLDVDISLLGQGDNQVISETYSTHRTREEAFFTHYTFLEKLDEFLSRTGPPLKRDETNTSEGFVIYGKFVIVNGAAAAMSGKRSARMNRMTNESYSTLESSVSALSANAMAAVESDHAVEAIYYMYLLELALCYIWNLRSTLLRDSNLCSLVQSSPIIRFGRADSGLVPAIAVNRVSYIDIPSEDLLLRLILCPRVFGGYPVLSLFSMIVKGFPDEVAENLSIFRAMCNMRPQYTEMIMDLASPILTTTPNYKLLYEHPTAVSLHHPSSPSDCRRSSVMEYLNNNAEIRNDCFRTFLSVANSQDEKTENMVKMLSSIEPCNPRVLSLIYGSTPDARARAVIGKIQKTATLARLITSEMNVNLVQMISNAEVNHFKGVLKTLYTRGEDVWTPNQCSVQFAKLIRDKGWQREIVGVSVAPPLEFGVFDAPDDVTGCDKRYYIPEEGFVGFDLDPLLTQDQLRDVSKIGSYAPYRGSVTKSKVSSLGSKMIQHSDALLKKPLTAVTLIGWAVKKDGNLDRFLREMLNGMTDADAAALIPEDEAICGSVQHRLQDDRTSHGGSMSLLYNMGTKIGINTSPLVNHCKGAKNTNLMFQSIMVLGVSLVGMSLKSRKFPYSGHAHFHIRSNCCIEDASEKLLDTLCTASASDCMHFDPNSPYLFKPSNTILQDLINKLSRQPNRTLPSNPGDLIVRKACALAEESMKIMRLVDFSKKNDFSLSSPVTINWALGVHGGLWIRNFTLRLLSYISLTKPLARTPREFMAGISTTISNSDHGHWKRLENVVFMDSILTQASSPPWYTRIAGNPQMSPQEIGKLIKNWVMAVLHAWIIQSDPEMANFPIFSRPSGPPDQHPAHLDTMRQYLKGALLQNEASIRLLEIRKGLRMTEEALSPQAYKAIIDGDMLLTAETTDYLAKAAARYELPIAMSEPLKIGHIGGLARSLLSHDKEVPQGNLVQTSEKFELDMVISPLSHLLKVAILPTTAAYKLFDILLSLNIAKSPFRGVFCAGDGSGGYTLLCTRLFKEAKVYYNTLKIPSVSIQQCDPIIQIPAFASYPDLEKRVQGLDMVNQGLSDLTHPQYAEAFMTRYDARLDLITCDAEGGGWEKPEKGLKMAENLARLATLSGASWVIMKTYMSSAFLIQGTIAIFKARFKSVSVFRTPYSSQGNTEVFIVATLSRKKDILECKISFPTEEDHPIVIYGPMYPANLWNKKAAPTKIESFFKEKPKTFHAHALTQLLSPYDQEISEEANIFHNLEWLKVKEENRIPHDIQAHFKTTMRLYPQRTKTINKSEIRNMTRPLATRMSIQWIACWAVANRSWEHLITRMNELLSHGSFLIYQLKNRSWSYSVSFHQFKDSPTVRCFPLAEIIDGAQKKAMLKLIGLLLVRGSDIKMTNEYNRSVEGGGLWTPTQRLRPGAMAINPEVRWKCQFIKDQVYGQYQEIVQKDELHESAPVCEVD
nr:RNA-dependent RNA polymerase [Frankliniella occidentalis associated mononegavirales virus 3]